MIKPITSWTRSWARIAGGACLTVLFIHSSASAQDYQDPPSRVARLSYTQGTVSFQPAGTGDWVQALVNRPMSTGDQLWSDRGSRAALHIGSASIHLSQSTGFSFLNLTDTTAQLELSTGSLRIRVKRLNENENFEVDTPNLAFSILRPGIYRISVDPSGGTTVIEDRRGEGEVTGGGTAYNLHAGDVGTFNGQNPLTANVENLNNQPDDFERWSEQRDHHEDVSISARYVSDDAIGYDDLDDNGGWRPVPNYGMVWFPHETVEGWAPYHYGHWAYIAPWGYTWVDDAAWGFAPFHYGRWIRADQGWGWVPCPPRAPRVEYVRPVYAPALVAWVGGAHFGIGISIGGGGGGIGGGVGWFPLAPREVYVPSYPVSRNYVNNVNISNTTVNRTVINNYYTNVVVNKTVNVNKVTYINQGVPGAVAGTSAQAFSTGQPVARNAFRMDPRQVASAPVSYMAPAAVPQRAAVLGGGTPENVRPPAAVQSRAVVVRTALPPPQPSFAQRQAAIQSNGGRPLSFAQVHQIAPARAQAAVVPQTRMAPPARVVAPANTQPQQPRNARTQVEDNPQHAPTAFTRDSGLEQQHMQQSIDLHKQQDQERRQVELQQAHQQQALQQEKASQARQQQSEQQRSQQLQVLEQRHLQQQQQMQQRQQEEHQHAQRPQAMHPPAANEHPNRHEEPKQPAKPKESRPQ